MQKIETQGRRERPLRTVAPLVVALFAACAPGCAPPAEAPAERGAPKVGGGGSSAKATDTTAPNKPLPPPAEMINEAKGVDTSKLSDAQRTTFFQLVNTEPSACGKPHSLAKSLKDDAECRDSLIVSQYASDRLAAGAAVSDVKNELVSVLDSLEVKKIPVDGRPVYGNDRAPVTVVVFADFECPHCRAEAPLLRAAVQQFRGQARLIYKHFPLTMHPRAKQASIATECAHEQGKFWQMHDQVFAHQTALEDGDLEKYARESGLDIPKYQACYASEKFKSTVEKDRADGEKLDIDGTPAVFVNGRSFNPMLFGGTVEGWIDDALRR